MNRKHIAKSGLGGGFTWHGEIEHRGKIISQFTDSNLLPQAMIDHIAGMIRGIEAPVTEWYVGLFENNYVPLNPIVASDLPTTIGECQAYSEASRPIWVDAYDGVGVIDNLASRCEFTMTQQKTIYGSFLISTSAKGGNTGLIGSIVRFSSPQVVPIGGVFRFAAGLTLIPTNLI
jgi:hypothetical protein